MASNPPLVFTTLTQPADTVSQSTPASPFDANTAYLLGQCCAFAYDQFAQGAAWAPDWSSLVVSGATVALATTSLTNPQPLTMAEAVGPMPTVGDAGYYVQLTAGFAVQLAITPTGGGDAQTIVVIALRGTRSWQEWINDLEAVPATFGITDVSVHAGFFADYTVGTAGVTSKSPLSTTGGRAAGSLAAQVAAYVSQLDDSLPLYVTGHSLGGALATLCALDVAASYPDAFSSLAMYSLGSPRVAVALGSTVDVSVTLYQQAVPDSYAIVHAADIVPILPPLSTSLPPGSASPLVTLTAAQVASADNTINFCAQTGDVVDNHTYSITYVPYLALLAAGFSAS